jgi:DNA-binding NtrC family response regulator
MHTDKTVKILVVDDNDELRKIVSAELADSGYEVDQACDGEEAIAKLQKDTIALMTLDLRMPKEDGWGVLTFLTEHTIKTRAIVLTGYANIACAMKAKKMGADAFLSKPYDIEELLFTINKVLNNDESLESISMS